MTAAGPGDGERLILVLDEGTSSTRALLYTPAGAVVASEQAEITQHYPQPGWVEHDPAEIWLRTLAVARAMVARAGGGDRIAAIGITNQRETAVAWDRVSGEPLARAIVWQDRRTADTCRALVEAAIELCRLAGVGETAVMSAVLRDDGEMARAGDLSQLIAEHRIVSVDIADIAHALARVSE